MADPTPGSNFVEFSDSDLLRNKLVEPAWYRVSIDKWNPWQPSNDQQSQNATYDATIKFNSDNGSTDFTGVPVELRFNSKPKARGFIEGFMRALGVDVTTGRYDMSQVVPGEIDTYIGNKTYEGRVMNDVQNKYRAVKQ